MADLPAGIVDNLFRHRYARMVAGLCRALGPANLDLVEDVVQDALLRALRVWPDEGVPDEPEAWVFRVARNRALDALRRRKVTARVEDQLQRWAEQESEREQTPEPRGPEHIDDDTLRMLFLCAHPEVPRDARVPLILKNVCGFGVPAIARALLKKEPAIAQRLVRAKAKLQGDGVAFAMPAEHELPERLGLVLQVVYLMFNEGYRAHAGEQLTRPDIVHEAVRLLALLLARKSTASHEAHALMAMMLMLGARMPARTDEHGDLVTLARQDRSKWDMLWLRGGFHHLRLAIGGERMTAYHCEARIASLHAIAPSYLETDWASILEEYDRLLQIAPTPIVRLNRAIALGKQLGAQEGLAQLAELTGDPRLDDYFLLGAVTAQFEWELGHHARAVDAFERALQQPCSQPERRLLQRRLAACRSGEPPEAW